MRLCGRGWGVRSALAISSLLPATPIHSCDQQNAAASGINPVAIVSDAAAFLIQRWFLILNGQNAEIAARPVVADQVRGIFGSARDVYLIGHQRFINEISRGDSTDDKNREFTDHGKVGSVGNVELIGTSGCLFVWGNILEIYIAEYSIMTAKHDIKIGAAVSHICYPITADVGIDIVAAGVGNLNQIDATLGRICQHHSVSFIGGEWKGLLDQHCAQAGRTPYCYGVESV